jgi:hypothetical protein
MFMNEWVAGAIQLFECKSREIGRVGEVEDGDR